MRAARRIFGVSAVGFLVASSLRAEPAFFETRVAPILAKHCTTCHGEEKQEGKLRVDSFAALMHGTKAGAVIVAGNLEDSEVIRRIKLPADDADVMPSDGKPLLSADEIKVLELWVAAGASIDALASAFPDAPALPVPKPAYVPLTPDWQPHAATIARLEKELGIRLVPRSQRATDGLTLRTASAPQRCDDAVLARLAPVAEYIVEAELGRTRVTDAGLAAVATFANLRTLDLTRTAVSSQGMSALTALRNLEVLNLTDTALTDTGLASLKTLPALKRLWLFGTAVNQDQWRALE